MQSFRAPRPTTNPYITMLDEALAASDEVEHLRFSWRDALLGDYDVFHWHWPEVMLHGTTWWKTLGKCVLTWALWRRLRTSKRIAVVRTVHNVELPDDGRLRQWLLRRIHRDADLLIALNDETALDDRPSVRIPHGHYRDWYGRHAEAKAEHVPGRIGAFGEVRRYKNLGALVDAYADAAARRPEMSLQIGGRPSSPTLAQSLEERATELPGLDLQLRFLEDGELVRLATQAELVVLAYRFMHNSGSVLAALSLDRPVLVPRNPVNESLAREVGEPWVQMYDGELCGEQLLDALEDVAAIPPDAAPDLTRRNWDRTAADHATAYRAAVQAKRARS
ncbi:MAG: glycosyltransferase [Actinomycetota bacterium]